MMMVFEEKTGRFYGISHTEKNTPEFLFFKKKVVAVCVYV